MKLLTYYPGTMGAGGRYTTGYYVSSGTESDFYRGIIFCFIILSLAILIYIFWINRK